jgi:hypothetical protein
MSFKHLKGVVISCTSTGNESVLMLCVYQGYYVFTSTIPPSTTPSAIMTSPLAVAVLEDKASYEQGSHETLLFLGMHHQF